MSVHSIVSRGNADGETSLSLSAGSAGFEAGCTVSRPYGGLERRVPREG